MQIHATTRLRLTGLYCLLFLFTGALLLGLNYALVEQRLRTAPLVVSNPLPLPDNQLTGALAGPIPLNDSQLPGVFALAQQELVNATLRELTIQSAVALLVVSVIAIGLGWVMAGRVLRPIQSITAVARRLSEQNLHERIRLEGPNDELKELADTFDIMLDRLSHAFDNQRRFIANASHELRTPLTIMGTEIDVTLADPNASTAELREMGQTIRGAINRSEQLIEGLLLLASSEQLIERTDRIDLAEAVGLAVAQSQDEARARELTISHSGGPAWVQGSQPLIERLVANLVENAVRYNQRGGWVQVITGGDATQTWLEVSNSGAVIPPDAVEGLFAPFRRLVDRTRSQRGVGLGLSIVRAITASHGGEVMAQARAEGGLTVIVRLPSAKPTSVALPVD